MTAVLLPLPILVLAVAAVAGVSDLLRKRRHRTSG